MRRSARRPTLGAGQALTEIARRNLPNPGAAETVRRRAQNHLGGPYGDEKERLWIGWRSRLKLLPMFANVDINPPGPDSWWLDIDNDDQLILCLDGLDARDLAQLKDLPIADLYLSDAKNVSDVGMLAEIPSLENVTVPVLARNVVALRRNCRSSNGWPLTILIQVPTHGTTTRKAIRLLYTTPRSRK